MTRFINTTLIGLVAFFVFLAVLWLFVDPAAPGLSTATAQQQSDVRIKGVEAHWTPGTVEGTELTVEVMLVNSGTAATVTQVAARATLDGQVVAVLSEDPPTSIPAGIEAPVRFTVSLPPDFAARWWQSYQARGETTQMAIDGSIVVRSAAVDVRLPFEWKSAWKGQLLDRLAASPQDCPGPPAPVCLEELDTAFKGGRLELTVRLRNDQNEALAVRSGSFRLVFEDVTVATGTLQEGLEIAPGEEEGIPVTLAFDGSAMSQWWGAHVARCETSRLSLNIGLELESPSSGTSLVDWDILAAPFQTGFACRGST